MEFVIKDAGKTAHNFEIAGHTSKTIQPVRADDSWQAGFDGAKPGIIMRGTPRPGDVYRQEYYPPGGALDQARVMGPKPSVTVPYGTYRRPLATVEWSPVEPQLEQKLYAPGIGEIEEQVIRGGHERFRLVAVTH